MGEPIDLASTRIKLGLFRVRTACRGFLADPTKMTREASERNKREERAS